MRVRGARLCTRMMSVAAVAFQSAMEEKTAAFVEKISAAAEMEAWTFGREVAGALKLFEEPHLAGLAAQVHPIHFANPSHWCTRAGRRVAFAKPLMIARKLMIALKSYHHRAPGQVVATGMVRGCWGAEDSLVVAQVPRWSEEERKGWSNCDLGYSAAIHARTIREGGGGRAVLWPAMGSASLLGQVGLAHRAAAA